MFSKLTKEIGSGRIAYLLCDPTNFTTRRIACIFFFLAVGRGFYFMGGSPGANRVAARPTRKTLNSRFDWIQSRVRRQWRILDFQVLASTLNRQVKERYASQGSRSWKSRQLLRDEKTSLRQASSWCLPVQYQIVPQTAGCVLFIFSSPSKTRRSIRLPAKACIKLNSSSCHHIQCYWRLGFLTWSCLLVQTNEVRIVLEQN